LRIKPDLLEAQRGLIMLSLSAKKFQDAISVARTVQKKQRPNEASGSLLEGDINAVQKNWDGAIAAYRAGLRVQALPDPGGEDTCVPGLPQAKTPDARKVRLVVDARQSSSDISPQREGEKGGGVALFWVGRAGGLSGGGLLPAGRELVYSAG